MSKADKVMILVAMHEEAQPLILGLGLAKIKSKEVEVYSNGAGVKLAVIGCGRKNTITTLCKLLSIGMIGKDVDIINVGYAGAKGYAIGEVLDVYACMDNEAPKVANIKGALDVMRLAKTKGAMCITASDFVQSSSRKSKTLFDMELYHILCFPYKSAHAIKVVSDTLDYGCFQTTVLSKAIDDVVVKVKVLVDKLLCERAGENVSRNAATKGN